MYRAFLWISLAFTSLSTLPVEAQELAGLRGVRIVVEDLDADAQDCGVTSDGMDSAARIVLSNSKLKLDKDVVPYVYLNANVIKSGTICVASLEVALRRPVFLGADFKSLITASVWRTGQLMTGRHADFGRRVNLMVEDGTKRLLGQWLRDNPN